MAVELRSLEREHLARIVECQQDAFSDYPVPAALDEVALSVYLRETGVSMATSWGAYVDGALVAFCLGAVRGSQGSIRGEGTVVAHRRQGIGSAVLERTLESLRDAGAETVGLEVLEQNSGAIELYRTARLRASPQAGGLEPAPPIAARTDPGGGDRTGRGGAQTARLGVARCSLAASARDARCSCPPTRWETTPSR